MAIGSDAEARSFAETRRTLLDALDRTEQEAHEQAAELVSQAERRAREITLKADQNAALLEEQLSYLAAQLDHVRGRVTDIRTRLVQELQAQADRRSPISRVPPPAAAAPPAAAPAPLAAPAPPVELAPTALPVSPEPFPHDPAAAADNDSLPETLRVLRAALESLNGEASAEPRPRAQ